VTLKLYLSNGREQLLTRELEEHIATQEPLELVKGLSQDGQVALGDREWCSLDSIVKAEIVQPEPKQGPSMAPGTRDEDVAAALKENYS